MPYVIGTDEAGYGPNLGPLAISATCWRVPASEICLYQSLSNTVTRDARKRGQHQIAIDDSKNVYQSGDTVEELERTVLSALHLRGAEVASFEDLLKNLCPEIWQNVLGQVAYDWDAITVPGFHERQVITKLAACVSEEANSHKIRLENIQSWLEFPASFNKGLCDFGNKASLLSARTCQLIRGLLTDCDDDVLIVCDKHGGRGHYAGLIQCELTEHPVRVLHESRQESTYCWEDEGKKVEIRFLAGGERYLPVALSSMTAKFLRELCMFAWNAFWRNNLPEIRPTAGYPQDARRFRNDISAKQSQLGIADSVIWRDR